MPITNITNLGTLNSFGEDIRDTKDDITTREMQINSGNSNNTNKCDCSSEIKYAQDLRSQLSKSQSDFEALKQKYSTETSLSASLQKQLNGSNSKIDTLNTEIATRDSTIVSLNADIRLLDTAKSSNYDKLEAARDSCKAEIYKLSESHKEDIKKLNAIFARVREGYENTNASLNSQLERLKEAQAKKEAQETLEKSQKIAQQLQQTTTTQDQLKKNNELDNQAMTEASKKAEFNEELKKAVNSLDFNQLEGINRKYNSFENKEGYNNPVDVLKSKYGELVEKAKLNKSYNEFMNLQRDYEAFIQPKFGVQDWETPESILKQQIYDNGNYLPLGQAYIDDGWAQG